MTLHVGVRDLHDNLSRYLREVEAGNDVMVTSRGKPVAKLTSPDDPLAELRRRGLVSEPVRPKRPSRDRPLIAADGSVSDLVAYQRR